VQNDFVAEPRQLVLKPAALWLDQHLTDLRKMTLDGEEEGRIDHQLFLLAQAFADSSSQLADRKQSGRPLELDRRVKGFKQWKAPDSTEVDGATRSHDPYGTSQNRYQVVDVGKVLNHGIQHDHVEAFRLETGEIVCRPVQQTDGGQVQRSELRPHVAQGACGEVGAAVAIAGLRKTKQQQTRATSDVEHAAGRERPHAFDRAIHPFPHLVHGNRQPGVTTVPAAEV
jgi:hypothetical protein